MMRIVKTLAGLVPAQKIFGVIISLLVIGWFGGVGFTIRFGETAANIALVPKIKETLDLHAQRIVAVEQRLGRAESADNRMMCLMEMTATGERVLAIELERTVQECLRARQQP